MGAKNITLDVINGSPNFTTSPTVPTPAVGDASQASAPTAFVAAAITTAVSVETTARLAADTAEATSRANADAAEATSRANADAAEATTRAAAITTLSATLATAIQNAAINTPGGPIGLDNAGYFSGQVNAQNLDVISSHTTLQTYVPASPSVLVNGQRIHRATYGGTYGDGGACDFTWNSTSTAQPDLGAVVYPTSMQAPYVVTSESHTTGVGPTLATTTIQDALEIDNYQSLYVASSLGIAVNQYIQASGTTLPYGTFVSSVPNATTTNVSASTIAANGSTIYINRPTSAALGSIVQGVGIAPQTTLSSIQTPDGTMTTSAAQNTGTLNVIPTTDTTGVVIGDLVMAPVGNTQIPVGATVQSISSNTSITISSPTTSALASGVVLSFYPLPGIGLGLSLPTSGIVASSETISFFPASYITNGFPIGVQTGHNVFGVTAGQTISFFTATTITLSQITTTKGCIPKSVSINIGLTSNVVDTGGGDLYMGTLKVGTTVYKTGVCTLKYLIPLSNTVTASYIYAGSTGRWLADIEGDVFVNTFGATSATDASPNLMSADLYATANNKVLVLQSCTTTNPTTLSSTSIRGMGTISFNPPVIWEGLSGLTYASSPKVRDVSVTCSNVPNTSISTLLTNGSTAGTITTNGSTTAGSRTILTTSTTNVAQGQLLSGTGIQPGSKVLCFTANTSITIDIPTTAIINTGTSLTLTSPPWIYTAAVFQGTICNSGGTGTGTILTLTGAPTWGAIKIGQSLSCTGLNSPYGVGSVVITALLSGTLGTVGSTYSVSLTQNITTAVTITTTWLNYYSAFKAGITPVNISQQGSFYNCSSVGGKYGVVYSTNTNHVNQYESNYGANSLIGIYVMCNGYDFVMYSGSVGGVWAGICAGSTNFIGSYGGVQMNLFRIQFPLQVLYQMWQGLDGPFQNYNFTAGGVSVNLFGCSFESTNEAAIQITQGSASYVRLRACTQQWGVTVLPAGITTTPQVNLFALGVVTSFVTDANGSDLSYFSLWHESALSGATWNRYALSISPTNIRGEIDTRWMSTINITNFGNGVNQWISNYRTQANAQKGDFWIRRDLASKANLLLNPENPANWVLNSVYSTPVIGTISSFGLSTSAIPEAMFEQLGSNPAIIKLTQIASGLYITLPGTLVAQNPNSVFNVSYWFFNPSTTTGMTATIISSSNVTLINSNVITSSAGVWQQRVWMNVTFAQLADASGIIAKINLGTNGPTGTVTYIAGLGIYPGEVNEYNPTAIAYASNGIAVGNGQGNLLSYQSPTLTSGSGAPSGVQPDGSVYMQTGLASGVTGVWQYNAAGSTWLILGSSATVTTQSGNLTTGSTVTIPAGCTNYVVQAAGNLAALTIVFPLVASSTGFCKVIFQVGITSLTIQPPSGDTMIAAPTGVSVAAGASYSKVLVGTVWS